MNNNITSHTVTLTVSDTETAAHMGSGDLPVLATPALVALMENAAMKLAAQLIDTDTETTVGSRIDVKHLLPSPIGSTVQATATLTERDGRRLTFEITATQDDNVIGTAAHTRYIVNREKFMAKI